LETFLETAQRSDVGFQVDASRIPIHPVVSRFAQAFQFEPLKMISSGTLVATIPPEHVESASQSLIERDISFADVGQVIEDPGVHILKDGQITSYDEIHCEADELARIWELYPRNDANDLDVTST
jgi:hydrogenase expression/formation protein HypE